ncbi:hypothetical protein BGW80DRAFT_1174495 [Lactifluus volemus]|nr:hypothetical protein BGW80DRAFT_1174495 [Lactifluus volemus]
MRQRLLTYPHQQDTDAGQAAYRRQIAQWSATRGGNDIVTHTTPVPLRPGTAAVCSGECYRCGTHGHKGIQCPQTTLDITEAPITQEEGREEREQEPEAEAAPARSERECDTIDLVRATFDDGAMICAMSTTVFEKVRHRLGAWTPSKRALRMANRTLTRSEASWTGTVELEGVQTTGTFEVFDSAGGWSFLLGKPMLQSFRACHDYEKGEIQVRDKNRSTVLTNQIDITYYAK